MKSVKKEFRKESVTFSCGKDSAWVSICNTTIKSFSFLVEDYAINMARNYMNGIQSGRIEIDGYKLI